MNYNSYSSSKTTYINCLFDENFNHLDGKLEENVFDKIKKFEKRFKLESATKKLSDGSYENLEYPQYKMKLKNVFYHNGKHYLGYIQSKTKKYHLVQFEK